MTWWYSPVKTRNKRSWNMWTAAKSWEKITNELKVIESFGVLYCSTVCSSGRVWGWNLEVAKRWFVTWWTPYNAGLHTLHTKHRHCCASDTQSFGMKFLNYTLNPRAAFHLQVWCGLRQNLVEELSNSEGCFLLTKKKFTFTYEIRKVTAIFFFFRKLWPFGKRW